MDKKASQAKTEKPLVTIVTATFNDLDLLSATINSIRSQTYKNFEWIIIDGGSTDGTVDLLKQNEDIISFWISEPDKGVYDAWNKAIKQSNGEWISFLGSGDKYYSNAVHRYIEYIQGNKNKNFDFVSSRVDYQYGAKEKTRIIGKPWKWNKFKKYMCTAHVGSFHNKRLFEIYGLFDDEYKITGDYELLLRPKENLCAGFFPDVTAVMISGGVSVANNRVFVENYRAKVTTAGRNSFIAYLEMFRGYLGLALRRMLHLS